MQVLDSLSNLPTEVFDSDFRQFEFPLHYVVEQVFSFHVLEYYVVLIKSLKDINQSDYVLMLTHLKNIDFPSLLEDLHRFHVLLLDRLNSNILSSTFMLSLFYKAKLSTANLFLDLVVLLHIRKSDCRIKSSYPVCNFVMAIKV